MILRGTTTLSNLGKEMSRSVPWHFLDLFSSKHLSNIFSTYIYATIN
jgi:hypothetical protein